MNDTVTVRQALRDAMADAMAEDARVVLLGEEVAEYQGAYKVSQGLWERFGSERVIDTPITEMGFAGLGVGAAWGGMRPIIEFMTFNFSLQAIDHLLNSAAKTLYMSGGTLACPIVFRGPNGVASRVGAQHSQCFASWYAGCPGLKVVAPYDAESAYGLLRAAIADPGPVVFLEHELLYGKAFPKPSAWPEMALDKAAVVRQGSDITLTAFSRTVGLALEAAEILAKEGVSAEVVDLRSLRPLDEETVVRSVHKTHRLCSLEDGWPRCGIGAEMMALAVEKCFDTLDAPCLRLSGADAPLPYAANLEHAALLSVARIVEAVREMF